MVLEAGLEPARLATIDFESTVSAIPPFQLDIDLVCYYAKGIQNFFQIQD